MLSTLKQLSGDKEYYRTTSCMDTMVNTVENITELHHVLPYPLRMHQEHTLELFVPANENTKDSATPKKIHDDMNDSQISFVAPCFQHLNSFLKYKNITELPHVWTL
jgi:hypothetical protein